MRKGQRLRSAEKGPVGGGEKVALTPQGFAGVVYIVLAKLRWLAWVVYS